MSGGKYINIGKEFVHGSLGISDKNLDLIGRILELKKKGGADSLEIGLVFGGDLVIDNEELDKKGGHFIEPDSYFVDATINLRKALKDIHEFEKYLRSHKLPVNDVSCTETAYTTYSSDKSLRLKILRFRVTTQIT